MDYLNCPKCNIEVRRSIMRLDDDCDTRGLPDNLSDKVGGIPVHYCPLCAFWFAKFQNKWFYYLPDEGWFRAKPDKEKVVFN